MQTTFICPDTNSVLEFELPSDETAIATLWSHPLSIRCPVCEAIHEASFKDAYVNGVMAQFRCLPEDLKEAKLQ